MYHAPDSVLAAGNTVLNKNRYCPCSQRTQRLKEEKQCHSNPNECKITIVTSDKGSAVMLLHGLITEEGSQTFKMALFLSELLNSVRLEWGNNPKMTWVCVVPFVQ